MNNEKGMQVFDNCKEQYSEVFKQLANYDCKFQRKYNDCLSIVLKERSRLGLSPMPDLSWVYEAYPTVESHPPNLVAELLEKYCKRREGKIQHGDLLCLRMGKEANLGMAYEVEEILSVVPTELCKTNSDPVPVKQMWVIYASEKGEAREPLQRRIIRCVESVWYL